MKRKILVLLLAVLQISVLCAPVRAAEVPQSVGEKSVALCTALGIFEGRETGEFDGESTLTRAELTAIAVRLLAAGTTSTSRDVFEDVGAEHWAYSVVTTAYDLKLINGIGDNLFAPDSPILYSEAVKLIVSVLGYEVRAEAEGGYPAGYLSVASALGLLRGLPGENAPISRTNVAILTANALEVPLMQRQDYSDAQMYSIVEGVTLLSQYIKVEKTKGQITASYAVSLSGTSMRTDEIEFAGAVVQVGKTDIAAAVGREVTLYSKTDNDVTTALYYELSPNTDAVTVTDEEITAATTQTKLVYVRDGREYNLPIASHVCFVYNGRPLVGWTVDELVPTFGDVTCIMDGGGAVQTIIVNSYVNLIVERVNTETKTIYFKAAPAALRELVADTTETSPKTILLDSNGENISLSRLAEWDIISVAQSRDSKQIKLLQSSAKIAGEIEEISDKYAIIKGISLKIAKSLTDNSELTAMALGESGEASLDFDGRIAAFNKSGASGKKYGYLIGVEMTKGLNARPQLKLFTEDGVMQVFATTEQVTLQGAGGAQSMKQEAVISPAGGLVDATGKVIEQLLMYKTVEGEINYLELAQESAGMNEAQIEEAFTVDERSDSAYYLPGNMCVFLSRFMVSAGTKIFNVPQAYDGDDKAYSILSKDKLEQKYYKDLVFYDIRRDNTISAFVTHETVSSGSIEARANIGIVTAVCSAVGAEGEEIVKCSVYNRAGKTIEMFADMEQTALFGTGVITNLQAEPCVNGLGEPLPEIPVSQIRVGDVVQYEVLTSGEIASIALRFRAETPSYRDMGALNNTESPTTKDLAYKDCYIMFGKVLQASTESIKVEIQSPNGAETWIRAIGYESMTLRLYDKKKNTVTVMLPEQIQQDDEIFCYRWTQNNGMLIVYR